jgi:hypothetical protein
MLDGSTGDILERVLRSGNLTVKLARLQVDEIAMCGGMAPNLEAQVRELPHLVADEESASSEKTGRNVERRAKVVRGEKRRRDRKITLASVVERHDDMCLLHSTGFVRVTDAYASDSSST